MVSTRKKDYGNAPPPRRRKSPLLPVTGFRFFSRLPYELQLMIWEASIAPRLIAVVPRSPGRTPHPSLGRTVLPSLLSVNHGSREVALDHYTIRLTLCLTVDETGKHQWDCPQFQSTTHHANVVMCPDDTLGFLGWETLDFKYGTRFQVKDANGSPWESFPESTGRVNKVAFLGRDLAFDRHRIVDEINSVVSWKLNSVLHGKSTTTNLKKWYGGWNGWTRVPPAAWSRELSIQSRNFDGSLEEWARRLIHRAKNRTLPLWTGAPNILAFELWKKPKAIHRPRNYLPAPTIQDLYRALPRHLVEDLLDDFYASVDWRWEHRQDRDSRGF